MLHFFPEPYEDEILYSVLARYHYYSGSTSFETTLKNLYGYFSSCSVLLPNKLSYLESRLPEGTIYTSDYFIRYHTILPLYYPFISSEKKSELENTMKKDADSPFIKLGLHAKQESRILRYCPLCCSNDISIYGEPYFHRVHQVHGVFVCPDHGCSLEQYPIYKSGLYFTQLCRLEQRYISFTPRFENNNGLSSTMLSISKSVAFILSSDLSNENKDTTYERYFQRLYEMNLLSRSGRIDKEKLSELYKSYYISELLDMISASLANNIKWLGYITISKKDHFINALNHILFMTMLFGSAESFFKYSNPLTFTSFVNFYPRPSYRNSDNIKEMFGEGPWPCLNPAADHYKELIITNCKIEANHRKKIIKGLFPCSCGYSYFAKPLDGATEIKKYRTKEYGNIWEEKLRYYIQIEGIKQLRSLERLMGCDYNTIVRYIDKLGLYQYVNQINYHYKNKHKYNDRNEKLEKHKNTILELIVKQPDITRTKICELAKPAYNYVVKYDKEWYESILLPNYQKLKKEKDPSEIENYWNDVDFEILHSLEKCYLELINSTEPVMISRNRLINMARKANYINNNRAHLSKTNEFLSTHAESWDDFHIRRIRKAYEELSSSLSCYCKDTILTKAGISVESYRGYSDRVKEFLEQLLPKEKLISP